MFVQQNLFEGIKKTDPAVIIYVNPRNSDFRRLGLNYDGGHYGLFLGEKYEEGCGHCFAYNDNNLCRAIMLTRYPSAKRHACKYKGVYGNWQPLSTS